MLQFLRKEAKRPMNEHYSNYLKKAVSAKQLVFDKVEEGDKKLISDIKKTHIKKNMLLLVLLLIVFGLCLWAFISFIVKPSDSTFVEVISLAGLGGGLLITGDFLYSIIGMVRGIRKGVVLSSSRLQEAKDDRNRSYQYVFDIYMEDRDESLMSYPVSPEVFSEIRPGDGVVIVKIGRKIKVMRDPDRAGVMDVSKIRSGV